MAQAAGESIELSQARRRMMMVMVMMMVMMMVMVVTFHKYWGENIAAAGRGMRC